MCNILHQWYLYSSNNIISDDNDNDNEFSSQVNLALIQEIVMPEVLYEEVLEVEERVVLEQDGCQLQIPQPLIQGNTGEKVYCKH